MQGYQKYGLCIGVNDYPGTGSDLSGCVNDAQEWGAALRRRGFDVRALYDAQATKEAIVEALLDLQEIAMPDDRVVVTDSSHGSFAADEDGDEPDGRDECLCPYDVATVGGLLDDELHEIFGGFRPGVRIVMISDSCHSGTQQRLLGGPAAPAVTGRARARFLPPAAWRAGLEAMALPARGAAPRPPTREPRALLLSGCQDHEYCYDAWFAGRPNGAFTRTALDLLPPPARPQPTYREWFDQISTRLPSARYPQTPNLSGPPGAEGWTALA